MLRSTLLGSAALAATAWFAFAAIPADTSDRLPTSTASITGDTAARVPTGAAGPPEGHLLLVVSGDARTLTVDHVVAKSDPWQAPHRDEAEWRIRVFAADGHVLGSYPIDLSAFDLRDDRRGKGLTVEGCKVTDTRVHALVSIPHHADAARIAFVRVRGEAVDPRGEVDARRWAELTEENR